MADQEKVALGFEGIVDEADDQQKSYTVQFTPAEASEDASAQEEINLLPAKSDDEAKPTVIDDVERKEKEQTVYLSDGVSRIDYVLTYVDQGNDETDSPKQDGGEAGEAVKDDSKAGKRRAKRKRFLEDFERIGLTYEIQDCSESPDRKTYYVLVHGKHDALLRGADEMLLRMPIKENNLHTVGLMDRLFFDKINVRNPFEPVVPEHLKIEHFFTAPFDYERKENYINWDNESKFFTTAQRSAVVWHLLQKVHYGSEDDQSGALRLLQNSTFTSAFPLHDSGHTLKKGEDKIRNPDEMSERQFLYHNWSFPTNWYKNQPLDHIRRYFGEKVGIYFTWLGFYTTWLLPASIIGLIVLLYGLSTVTNPIASDICHESFRYDFYMCPRCDALCDFWFLTDSCAFSRLAQVFDNGGTVFFAIFMSFWAVLFLEFWKRRQYQLQYDWDVLGFEDTVERARPQFEQRIKKELRKRGNTPVARKKFVIRNPVTEKDEYIQPPYWIWPKISTTFVILISMVAAVIGIVIAVLLYRLAVAGAIYELVNGLPLGPTVGDIVVAITGAVLQLVAILLMNKLYSLLAYHLTNWELHRTQTDYEDSFTTKMYLFQFVNFYASLFYIAFFKGNLSGNPGDYQRIANLRVDECATYGCLFELTIQLAIIMVGKQLLNNTQELALPYVKHFVNKYLKHKKETEEDVYTRWEKDFDLIPIDQHGLFSEYLELVIQYGFITIFVAAFPLAPFFALLNNWIEIRLDAHKFTAVLRRPRAERAQDIGAWFTILTVVSQLAVITNAFLISITAQFVPIEVFALGGFRAEGGFLNRTDGGRATGYVDWSLSSFRLDNLVDGSAFPASTVHELQLYDIDGNRVTDSAGDDLLYLPFINFNCLDANGIFIPNNTLQVFNYPQNETYAMTRKNYLMYIVNNDTARNAILPSNRSDTSPMPITNFTDLCFNREVQCRFRGFVEDDYDVAQNMPRSERGVRYWQVQTARLAFVILFEHFIFVISAVLAFLVPDVPQSVKNEIQREKLLAFEALHPVHVREREGHHEGGGAQRAGQ